MYQICDSVISTKLEILRQSDLRQGELKMAQTSLPHEGARHQGNELG